MVTSRQQRMLTQLLEARQYITLKSFTEEYGISLRTLRNDLLQIEDWLRGHGVQLKRNRAEGVRLELGPGESDRLALHIQERPAYMDAQQRTSLLLKHLLQDTGLSIKQILEEYEISKNTLLLDLAEIKAWLEKRKLVLHKERGLLTVQGREYLKRSAYLELLRAEITDDKLLRYMLDPPQPEGKLQIASWNIWFKTEDAMMLFDAIQRLEPLLEIQLSDAGYSTLTLHLLMAMERIKNHHVIEMDEALLNELEATRVFAIVQKEIVPAIEHHFGVGLPLAEVGYITQHVLGAQKQNIAAGDELFTRMAEQIVLRFEQALGRSLQLTEQIVQGLVIHLKPAVYRAKFNLQTKNPLMQQLEAQYGTMLSMLEDIVNHLVKPLSVTLDRDEIGYIMLHIGSGLSVHLPPVRKRIAIVCASGLGTSAIIKRQVSTIFPQVDVVGTFSYKEAGQIDSAMVDAILTTIEISGPIRLPWLQVSPLLTEHDRRRIAVFIGVPAVEEAVTATAVGIVNDIYQIVEQNTNVLNKNRLLEQLLLLFQGGRLPESQQASSLSELLPVDSIRLQQEGTGWESAIRMANQLLMERGASTLSYADNLISMISSGKHSFIIHSGVAFPHAYTPQHIVQTAFSLITFREPISFGPSGHPVWLIITLAAVDKEQHVAALGTLLDVLNDASFIQLLRQTSDQVELWRLLKEKGKP